MVAGIDGCRGGWLAVTVPACDLTLARIELFETFAAALSALPTDTFIAIDIPIGLPERVVGAGRRCDRDVRAVLGPRRSSVFTLPSRSAVFTVDYQSACAVAAATSDPPRKVSKQAFFLFDKVREVDAAMTPDLQRRVVECHPEAAFWVLNDQQPLAEPKKQSGRPHAPGIELRRGLLTRAGFNPGLLDACPFKTSQATIDDLLDAAANAMAAARIAAGYGIVFPANSADRDGRGLAMQIWA